MKKRVLFVDDDPRILSGLQSLFRKDRMRWEMVFALGGQRALDELGKEHFDVVVTDMRMPEVDGATLLLAVNCESPATLRILLTGYSNDAALARVRPVIHRLLDKPCSPGELRAAIESSAAEISTDGVDQRI